MARRGKSDSGLGIVIIVALGVLAFLARFIIDYWPFFLITVIAYVAYRYSSSSSNSSAKSTVVSPVSKQSTIVSSQRISKPPVFTTTRNTDPGECAAPLNLNFDEKDALSSFATLSPVLDSKNYSIPVAPAEFNTTRWLSKSETITIGGIQIHGGFLYVGSALKSADGSTEPALIDPQKPIAKSGHYRSQKFKIFFSNRKTGNTL